MVRCVIQGSFDFGCIVSVSNHCRKFRFILFVYSTLFLVNFVKKNPMNQLVVWPVLEVTGQGWSCGGTERHRS